jgi:hypothetical protein
MPNRFFVIGLLCAILGSALCDLHSDFLKEVNEIAEAEVSDDRTIIHDKTDSQIVAAQSVKSTPVVSVPLISKAVANDPHFKQHFLDEVSSMNGQESSHRDNDSAHADALLKQKNEIAKEQKDLARKEAKLAAMNQLAAIRKRLAALKQDEAEYDSKAKAQASKALEEMSHAQKERAAEHNSLAAVAPAVPKPPPISFDWNPAGTHFFHPHHSVSFVLKPGAFDVTYGDGSKVAGQIGEDIVQLGNYFRKTKFGLITECNDGSFDNIDGILGLGLPMNAITSGINTPLFTALTDRFLPAGADNHILKVRKFTIFSSNHAAELQLGGTDPACIDDQMVHVPSLSTAEYSVPVESMKLGGIELLSFSHPAEGNYVPAILDSGASCIVMPDSVIGGQLTASPMQIFSGIKDKKGLSIYIKIKGSIFEIPFDNWYRPNAPKGGHTCLQPSAPGDHGIILGDVIFRSMVVEFDLTHPSHPQIGLAARNEFYKPILAGDGGGDGSKVPLYKEERDSGQLQISIRKLRASRTGRGTVEHLPVTVDYMQTAMYVKVSVGSPKQDFKVLVDTGSSDFAVFSHPYKPETLQARDEEDNLFNHHGAMNDLQKYRTHAMCVRDSFDSFILRPCFFSFSYKCRMFSLRLMRFAAGVLGMHLSVQEQMRTSSTAWALAP